MLIDDLIVLVLLLVFVSVIVGIRLKATAAQGEQTAETSVPSTKVQSPPKRRARRRPHAA